MDSHCSNLLHNSDDNDKINFKINNEYNDGDDDKKK